MGEKTEEATPKKLSDARKKGQVARSQDMPSATTFIVSIVVTLALFDWILGNIQSFMISCFKLAGTTSDKNLESYITGYMVQSLVVTLTVSLPVVLASTLTGMLTNFLIIGPLLSFEAFYFDPQRFNPVENLKQKFKMKTLIELLKSILKITVAIILITYIIIDQLPSIVTTITMPLIATAEVVKEFFRLIVVKVGIFFLVVALADYIYQKMNFAKEMKMEKHEVKQEYKNTEGDPEIKGKRKQMAHEIAFSDGPSKAKRARALVTNPTEIAVAIGYDPEEGMVVPYILAKGQGLIAQMMINEAKRYDVPILQNIYLARKLFEEGSVDQFVPEETYEAIAEILRWVATLRPADEQLSKPW
jgi:type III secretion YscU/HrpY family protein